MTMDLKTIKELNSLAVNLMQLWNNMFVNGYVLYVDTHNIEGLPHAVVYGNGFLLSPESYVQHPMPSLVTTIEQVSNARETHVSKMALFDKEEFFYYKVVSSDDDVTILIGISSMIYGRSHGRIAECRKVDNDMWQIVANHHNGAVICNGYLGSLQECFMRIIDVEMHSESPYEDMKEYYPERYESAMQRALIVNIEADGGINVNSWFGI